MAKKNSIQGPKFVQYFGPVLEALKELGGSGRPTEVKDLIVIQQNISDAEQSEQIESGGNRFSKNVDWARFYLSKAGFIDSSERGVWSLTEKGFNTKLSHEDAYSIFRDVHKSVVESSKSDTKKTILAETEAELNQDIIEDHHSMVLNVLKNLSATGFERFCQRLLRESGFQNVEITGRTGDGGIDGHGILQVNPFVSFQIYFQCKKYSASVGSGVIRDFRGATLGRGDKGLILTTGTFTAEARKEATRDGAPPIELVDGDKIVEMLERIPLGLKPEIKTTYKIENKFFDEFRD